MRGLLTLAVCGCLGAAVAAPALRAQGYGPRGNGGSGANRSTAPTPDQFVSTPGQMVSTPGQMVNGPGQVVMTPGQSVFAPGLAAAPIGQTISPTPGVIAPFVRHSKPKQMSGQLSPSNRGKSGVTPGRHFRSRHQYRPLYGASVGYDIPYFYRNESGTVASSPVTPGTGREVTRAFVRRGQSQQGRDAAAAESIPSGNRPPYRVASDRAPRVSNSQAASSPHVTQSREPQLTIVMKNGAKRKVRNYALTPTELIDLDKAASGREVSIPLSKINLAATKRAAARAGLSFAVPTS